MNSDIFLRIDGITGECQDAKHRGWINIDSFTWGATQPANLNIGSGSGAGKVSFHNLIVFGQIDKATPAILKYTSNGKHIKKVEISACKAAGDEALEYCLITLEDVIIAGINYMGVNQNGIIGVTYQFQASKVKQSYWEQQATGNRGAVFECGWDIKGNCEM